MKATRLSVLVVVLTLVITLSGAAGARGPQLLGNGGCVAGDSYDPACDVNHDDVINVQDLELVADHWRHKGAWTSDNNHDHLGQTWTGSNNSLVINGGFNSAPLVLSNTTGAGVRVNTAFTDGVYISSTGNDGVEINSAGGDGVFVNSAIGDGVFVSSTHDDGVDVTGDDLAGYFFGNVEITGSCTNCTLATFARNTGQSALEPGDVVAVRGVTHPDLLDTPVVMDVELATGSDAVIGVVAGRAELDRYEDRRNGGKAVQRLVPREGPAQPGEYVNIITHGLARVKASARAVPIKHGMRLTAADQAGHARAVQTVEVQGMQFAENTPVIGVALENLEAGQGLIWVLVNLR